MKDTVNNVINTITETNSTIDDIKKALNKLPFINFYK